VIFLGFWFVPHTVIDVTAAAVAFVSFLAGTVIGGRFARHLEHDRRRWVTVALGMECLLLVVLSILAGAGVLDYHDDTKLILIAGLAWRSAAERDGPAVRHSGAQHDGSDVHHRRHRRDSRLAGGTGKREKLASRS